MKTSKQINPNYSKLVSCITDKGFRGVVLEGGSRCFSGDTNVILLTGDSHKIENIKNILPGQIVMSFDEKTNIVQPGKVNEVFVYKNEKRIIEIKLKNGQTIKCSEDHKFYYNGRWIEIRNILPLCKKTL